MSNIDKRALREAAEKALSAGDGNWQTWREAGMNYPEIFTSSGHIVATVNGSFSVVRSDFIAAANPATVLSLLDEIAALEQRHCGTALLEQEEMHAKTVGRLLDALDAAEKRVAELEASHSNLREAMAGIHNTIRGEGAYTPLEAILNASKRAYEESATAAGKGK
ncbi:ead/Ea22-like family protein [Enterobacter hormaechei]|uniref:ead/Ea22-like family protein n=1 Tax=Enterobacter hormaechei TaxID=158836 RepID=UPI000F81805A|nr:ead/Ea22-like family protein [Enterobacter hormaechei]MDE7606667.1 ead/Ea22-like family protein [Enterobacter hormaechei]RTO74460.1 ead/Ea22-like family protein [Enterobacter hormaechei]